ncbi:hypothetical protein Moror_14475 [Moniliophthora roreri MCA 2997]|uniref:Uncharacterized protein n=1 Tax=Moniliophthora roreri (strain MCA 2997) TaxID=1381753 RepID=V2WNS2_MONRO|nr:hypothetical protein Moror_14475 [Moniliophthora roreri MCA 2997]
MSNIGWYNQVGGNGYAQGLANKYAVAHDHTGEDTQPHCKSGYPQQEEQPEVYQMDDYCSSQQAFLQTGNTFLGYSQRLADYKDAQQQVSQQQVFPQTSSTFCNSDASSGNWKQLNWQQQDEGLYSDQEPTAMPLVHDTNSGSISSNGDAGSGTWQQPNWQQQDEGSYPDWEPNSAFVIHNTDSGTSPDLTYHQSQQQVFLHTGSTSSNSNAGGGNRQQQDEGICPDQEPNMITPVYNTNSGTSPDLMDHQSHQQVFSQTGSTFSGFSPAYELLHVYTPSLHYCALPSDNTQDNVATVVLSNGHGFNSFTPHTQGVQQDAIFAQPSTVLKRKQLSEEWLEQYSRDILSDNG